MRTREKQRIFRRFFRGESIEDLAWIIKDQGHVYSFGDGCEDIEQIIREGVEKKWEVTK